MYKKGAYDFGRKTFYIIVVLFVLAFIFGVLYASFGGFSLNILRETNNVAGKVLIQQMVYSPLCFSYVDKDTSRSYPGIIDISKFKNETLLSKCGKYYKDKFGVILIENGTLLIQDNDWLDNRILFDYLISVPPEKIVKIGKASEIYTKYFQRPVIIKYGTGEKRGVIIVGIES